MNAAENTAGTTAVAVLVSVASIVGSVAKIDVPPTRMSNCATLPVGAVFSIQIGRADRIRASGQYGTVINVETIKVENSPVNGITAVDGTATIAWRTL
jgi:hypothetical protein